MKTAVCSFFVCPFLMAGLPATAQESKPQTAPRTAKGASWELCASCKKYDDQEVRVAIRLVSASPNSLKKAFAHMKNQRAFSNLTEDKKTKVIFLTDVQVRKLLIHASTQRDANVMQAPRITVFNGQQGKFEMIDQMPFLTGIATKWENDQLTIVPDQVTHECGLRMTVLPMVNGDGKTIQTAIEMKCVELAGHVPMVPVSIRMPAAQDNESKDFRVFVQCPKFTTIHVRKELRIPAGQSALIHCGTPAQKNCADDSAPLLGPIPYLGRLFSSCARPAEPCEMYLLVSTQVVE